MEKSFPSPRELLQVRMALLLVTRALMVHLGNMDLGSKIAPHSDVAHTNAWQADKKSKQRHSY